LSGIARVKPPAARKRSTGQKSGFKDSLSVRGKSKKRK
jgi:hypothetical protein